MCASNAALCLKLLQSAIFWHSNASVVQNIGCVAHFCAGKLRIAAILRNRNVLSQPLTAGVATHGLTDDEYHSCILLWEYCSNCGYDGKLFL